MGGREKYHELPAIRGIQAGKPYYSIMCPLHMVVSLFTYTDSSLPPEMRLQRVLNKQRIPEMKDYILSNRESYVFSALTASIDGDIEFISQQNSSLGSLKIPMNARILINDGQHRRAAIEAALIECPDLRYEDISIVVYHDLGLERSQQMFSDLNRYAVRPTKSLNILYDNRNAFSILVKECIQRIPMFKGNVESEKSTISNRSKALFTLSGIFHATKIFLSGLDSHIDDEMTMIIAYWSAVTKNMPIWQMAKSKIIPPEDFRKNYICAHAIALKALGQLGNKLLNLHVDLNQWEEKLSFLKSIDWNKSSIELQGLVIMHGRISSSSNNQKAFADYLIMRSGWLKNAGGNQ